MSLLKQSCFLLVLIIESLAFGQNPKSKMSIELSIPHSGELALINNCLGKSDVFIIIHNDTDSVNYFYEDWNSFGYYNITFEIKHKDSIYEIRRPEKIWYRNFASYQVINPNESLVFIHHLMDTSCSRKLKDSRISGNGWLGVPVISDTVEIRTIYQLCHLTDSIPGERIDRLNYGRDFYIDYLDGDIESEAIIPDTKTPKSPGPKPIIIFNKPLVSEWQTVLLY